MTHIKQCIPKYLNKRKKQTSQDLYFLNHLITKITNIKHKKYLSDHRTIEINIIIEELQDGGKGYLKINNYYL